MKKSLIAAMSLAVISMTVHAEEGRLLRFPTTNGTDVVFSYAGDLYKAPLGGGEAQRLTSHVGYEMFARFSPDGHSIAFTGQYDGNTEVYLMSVNGGQPVRLTYTSTNSRDDLGDRMGPNNVVMTWTPDGQKIVYRNRISDGFDGKLWTVSKNGGMSEQIPLPEGGFCSYSPDGKKFAYNRVFREFRTWKYYKGGMADDIWIYDPATKNVENVTNNVSQDIMPMWIGDEIFFISDRDRTMNLFVYNTKTKALDKVTDYTDYDVRFPSSNGKMIVYEHAGYLYKFDPVSRQSVKINISMNAENVYARTEMKNTAKNITNADLSLDGKRVVITARGEVFDVPVTEGITRNVTHTPGSNDREACWSPDGKNIAYIADKTGETEIWLQPADGGSAVQLTKDNDTYIRSCTWSPDGKKILYTDRKNRIVIVDVTSKAKKTIMQNPEGEFGEVNFSPDSQWITYTKPAKNNFQVIYVYNLNTGKEFPVTEKWYSSSSPIFSSDGKYLIFASARDLNPIYGELEWNHVYTDMEGIYVAILAKATSSPLQLTDGDTSDNKSDNAEKAAPTGKKKGEAKKESTVNPVNIDADGIFDRIIKIPVSAGSYSIIYSDGKKIWYNSGRDLNVYDIANKKEQTIYDGATLDYKFGSKKALLHALRTNKVYVMDLPEGAVTLDKPVDTGNMTAMVDYPQEWAQIFDEAWRAFRDGFYQEDMHKVDWKAMKQKYSVFLPYVKCRLDLNYVIGGMIGELACGHAYVSPGEYAKAPRVNMGLLGAKISRDKSGFYRIDHILPGASYRSELHSPLSDPGLNVKEGDYITAIDGISTTTTDNIYSLLAGKANILTELSINSQASENGSRKIVVKPTDDEYPLYHYEWVQNNIKKVEKATNGRVGYIYIPDMGPEGLNEFARYFYPQIDKEALIIDDRANGGGNVSPMILERLNREVYRATMSRTSTKIGTVPDAAVVGPKVCLVNKYSASDGDLFPWGFKALKVGKLIGTRTWGGIIGISGSLPYMDGTDIRVPFFTSYDAKTGKWIIENHGVDPDILIDNDPVKEEMGEDQQLNKAIEVILDELKTRTPVPPVPSPRDFSK